MTVMTRADLARDLVRRLGGRFSTEMGIRVDRGPGDVEQWFLGATLFGTRISAKIAEQTFHVLRRAGVRRVADAGERTWDQLVKLLDEGGYTRYDFRTASRLLELARTVGERYGGRITPLGRIDDPAELEAALDALPGWGPVTVRVFLRELRGVWPGADPPLDDRALGAGRHLALIRATSPGRALEPLRRVADAAGVDLRDLEAALVRLSLAHGKVFDTCPGGRRCRALAEAT